MVLKKTSANNGSHLAFPKAPAHPSELSRFPVSIKIFYTDWEMVPSLFSSAVEPSKISS